ncbi:MAG: hypothetical protein P8M80_15375 [Pirellulaceae bacterium]|nr:hypothetical protein [Pirellulaceae bacterium]
MLQRTLIGLIAVAFFATHASAQCGCGDAVSTSPGAAAGGDGSSYITRKVWVPEWTTETRTRNVTRYKKEARTRTYNVTKRVPVTTQKEVSYTVRVPYTETVQKTYTVRVPYMETVQKKYTVRVPYTEKVQKSYQVRVPYTEKVEKTYTVLVPHKEQRTGTRTVRVPYQETVMRTVRRIGGHWETREMQVPTLRGMMGGLGSGWMGVRCGCASACDGAAAEPSCGCDAAAGSCGCGPCSRTICRKVWVPEIKCCEKPVCVTRFKCEERPYTYCVTVCKKETRTKTCCVRKFRCETRTRNVCVRKYRCEERTRNCCVRKYRCETRTKDCCVRKFRCETRTKTVCCRSWKCVTEQKTCNYTVCVPYCEAQTYCVKVRKRVCKEIQVPCCSCDPCGDACCWGLGSRMRGMFHGMMSRLSCGCGGCGSSCDAGCAAAAEPSCGAEG